MTRRLRPYAEFFVWLRAELGFTQAEMAKALACEQGTICRIEKGTLPPPLETLELAYCLSKSESFVAGRPEVFYRAHALLCRHVGGANG